MAFPEQVTPNSPAAGCDAYWSQDCDGQNAASAGPFRDPISGVDFLICQDDTTLKMRAYQRVAGVWSEADAIHAPDSVDDSVAPTLQQFFGVEQDKTKRLLYVFRWDPVAFLVTCTLFNTATASWGASFLSTLGYQFNENPGGNEIAGFGTKLRPDGICWVSWFNGVDLLGNGQVAGAKFNTTSLTWDGAVTFLGDTTLDLSTNTVLGMAMDSASNIHLICWKRPTDNSSKLYHQVIHADNSLSAIQVIATTPVGSIRWEACSYPTMSETDVLSFVAQLATISFNDGTPHVFRAQCPADAPVWEDTQPSDMLHTPVAIKSPVSFGGNNYVFYMKPNGANMECRYVSSAGIGQPWNASVLVGSQASGKLSRSCQVNLA